MDCLGTYCAQECTIGDSRRDKEIDHSITPLFTYIPYSDRSVGDTSVAYSTVHRYKIAYLVLKMKVSKFENISMNSCQIFQKFSDTEDFLARS